MTTRNHVTFAALALAFALVASACTSGQAPALETAATDTAGVEHTLGEEREVRNWDVDGDGVTDTATTRTWAANQVVRKGVDTNADGRDDRIEHLVYDATGQVVREATDRNADGTIDSLVHFRRDAQGRLLARELDHDADGQIDRRRIYRWDDAGQPLVEAVDSGADGRFERVEQWVRDADGELLTRTVLRFDGKAASPRWVRSVYADNGKMISRDMVENVALPLSEVEIADARGQRVSDMAPGFVSAR